MIVVTGGAGFVGSNVVQALSRRSGGEVVVVDDVTDGRKLDNLAGADPADFVDRDDFERLLDRDDDWLAGVTAVVHQGACTDTTERDGRRMMRDNFEASKRVARACARRRIPLVYASSAAVYGTAPGAPEDARAERPLNPYAWSKLLFDRWVERRGLAREIPVAGLRYFNVYGPREAHKGPMASLVWQLHRQLLGGGPARLFAGSHGLGDGEQRRDFVHVRDVVAVVLFFLDHPEHRGLFNVGTGEARTFLDLARAVVARHGKGEIEFVPFPEALQAHYQPVTRADLGRLRAAGYPGGFLPLEEGVREYLDWAAGGAGAS